MTQDELISQQVFEGMPPPPQTPADPAAAPSASAPVKPTIENVPTPSHTLSDYKPKTLLTKAGAAISEGKGDPVLEAVHDIIADILVLPLNFPSVLTLTLLTASANKRKAFTKAVVSVGIYVAAYFATMYLLYRESGYALLSLGALGSIALLLQLSHNIAKLNTTKNKTTH